MDAEKNIVFIGFMGSGKSLVSKELGGSINWEVLSTDSLIEEKEQKPIYQIFAEKGEPYFRQIECEIVQEAAQRKGIIIDCGGGVVLNPENIKALKANGFLVYLYASAEFIYGIVKDQKNRPLLNVENPLEEIKRLLKERKGLYGQADLEVCSENKSIEEISKEVESKLGIIQK